MQEVVISAGNNSFSFKGEILEMDDEHIILRADKGDIYIERKYLVFIQILNEEPAPIKKEQKIINSPASNPPHSDKAAQFIKQRLKYDPVAQKMDEPRLVPPSQLPDQFEKDIQKVNDLEEVDEDAEALANVYSAFYGPNPVSEACSLKQAVKAAMGQENEFQMGSTNFKTPLQTILSMNNANTKKTK
jgi:hypothetical protein